MEPRGVCNSGQVPFIVPLMQGVSQVGCVKPSLGGRRKRVRGREGSYRAVTVTAAEMEIWVGGGGHPAVLSISPRPLWVRPPSDGPGGNAFCDRNKEAAIWYPDPLLIHLSWE